MERYKVKGQITLISLSCIKMLFGLQLRGCQRSIRFRIRLSISSTSNNIAIPVYRHSIIFYISFLSFLLIIINTSFLYSYILSTNLLPIPKLSYITQLIILLFLIITKFSYIYSFSFIPLYPYTYISLTLNNLI